MKYVKIKSIEEVGIKETWDIEMPSPNNYIANKFVVHNSGQSMQYSNRKAGKEEVKYMHPILEPITKNTYGCILYQEQIMHIMNKAGAMSWATAEMARKVITKSKGKGAFEKMRNEFVNNAVNINGFDKIEAEALYDTVSMFGSYSFNKTHAYGYSMISYYCAWLKHYYPLHFYKALLKYENEDKDIKKFVQDAEKRGIFIEMPDINHSDFSYKIHDEKIYAGINSIMGIGKVIAKRIISCRPYTSLKDFKKRCKVSSKVLNGLIIADAFREFKINKKEEFYRDAFDEDFTPVEHAQLIYEYTALSPRINISESFDFGNFKFINIEDLPKYPDQFVMARGIVTDSIKKDKLLRPENDHPHKFERRLVYLNLNDDTGNIVLHVGPETYEKYSALIPDIKKQAIICYGKTNREGTKIIADMIDIASDGFKTNVLQNIFHDTHLLEDGESYILSAHPAVSKKGWAFYRIKLSNGKEGMAGALDKKKNPIPKLLPGMKVKWNQFEKPFINIEVINDGD